MRPNSTIQDKYDRCSECRTGKEVRVFGKPPLCHFHEVIRLQNRQIAKAKQKQERAAIEQGDGKTALTTSRQYPSKDATKTQAARAKKHLSKYSAKEERRQRVYNAYIIQWKKDNPLCLAKLDGCQKFTVDNHHKKGRGPHLLDVETFLPVCRSCHDKIGLMPIDEAVSRGLSLYRNRNNDAA